MYEKEYWAYSIYIYVKPKIFSHFFLNQRNNLFWTDIEMTVAAVGLHAHAIWKRSLRYGIIQTNKLHTMQCLQWLKMLLTSMRWVRGRAYWSFCCILIPGSTGESYSQLKGFRMLRIAWVCESKQMGVFTELRTKCWS